MQNSNTLSLKKPAQKPAPQPARPEKGLVGKLVTVQTRSPSRIVGTVKAFDHGWLQIVGTEYRWQSDGLLSEPVTSGTFTLDRSTILYLCEVM